MIILDEPYVSPELAAYAAARQEPVLDNATARARAREYGAALNLVSDDAFAALCQGAPRLYTCSENALEWVYKKSGNNALMERIWRLKDKAACRDLLAPLYGNFFFRRVTPAELAALSFEELKVPCVLKPAVGFFSLGVYSIENAAQWEAAKAAVAADAARWSEQYPPEVVGGGTFLLEEYIQGEEYAVDVYFDEQGRAVVCDILRHEFSSAADVSDRLYYTSREIIESRLTEFEAWFNRVNGLLGLRNFPVHVELRRDDKGRIAPIEFNPLRFAGWCSTDVSLFAWGFHSYGCFLEGSRPDWERALAGKAGKLYTLMVLNKPENCPPVQSFDYDALRRNFGKVLHLRPCDFRRFSHFGFLFTETPADRREELDRIIRSDLTEYMQ